MSDEKKDSVVRVESHLNEREEVALQQHLKAREPGLSPTLQAEMFELYLKGATLEEIARVNKGIRLGAIVRAWKEGDWHNRRLLYLKGLFDGLRERVQQAQGESVTFLSDLLATAHKLHGDKLRRYLQTGDEKELGDLAIKNLGQYKMALELLLKATGQDGQKTVKVSGQVKHEVDAQPNVPATVGPMSSEQAMNILFALQGKAAPPLPKKDDDDD